MVAPSNNITPFPAAAAGTKDYQLYYFSELFKRPICAGKITDRIGRLSDLVVKLAEPYPEVVGIYVWHGWGQPTEFIPWNKVLRIEDDAIFVGAPVGGGGWGGGGVGGGGGGGGGGG
ncbi:MAG: PRC-barrel domain-containing protein, partial [Bacillota bacterium]